MIKNSVLSGMSLLFRARKNVVPILTYHSIDNSGSIISVTKKRFAEQMKYLKSAGYRTITLGELLKLLKADTVLSEKNVVITFDDGYKNNFSEAFPILREYGFNATVFPSTDYIEKKGGLLAKTPFLSWADIQEMNKYGIEFGSHGCSHPNLPKLSEKELRTELKNSKSMLESNIGESIHCFCYPYGEYNEQVQGILREVGYGGACTIEFGVDNTKDNLFALNRIGTAHFKTIHDFNMGLTGVYDRYEKLKKIMRLSPIF